MNPDDINLLNNCKTWWWWWRWWWWWWWWWKIFELNNQRWRKKISLIYKLTNDAAFVLFRRKWDIYYCDIRRDFVAGSQQNFTFHGWINKLTKMWSFQNEILIKLFDCAWREALRNASNVDDVYGENLWSNLQSLGGNALMHQQQSFHCEFTPNQTKFIKI